MFVFIRCDIDNDHQELFQINNQQLMFGAGNNKGLVTIKILMK